MLARFFGIVAALILGGVLISPAAAQKVALVIGNSEYKNAIVLPNAVNDAGDIGSALSRLGFTVITLTNATAETMQRSLGEFADRSKGAEMAVVLFAGHAIEVDGMHWSIPVDGKVSSLDEVKAVSVNLDRLLASTEGSKFALVLIDTARDNPFVSDKVINPAIRNNAPVKIGDALIVYSTKTGTRPLDGEGRNSPFVAALLKHIATPGLDLPALVRRVRDEVLVATQGKQEPFAYGSLPGNAVTLAPAR